jgi:AraC family transcriptional regulator of adaptative response/methylated-DNA-[protein]-cysteine methyltransferase
LATLAAVLLAYVPVYFKPMSDYQRIERAIEFIQANLKAQPSLEDIARHVHLSPYHFARLFSRWAGTTPKRFLQVLTLELGKELLAHNHSVQDTAHQLGLSGPSRLHDHFVHIEAVSPGEFKSTVAPLIIRYGSHPTLFGPLFVAQTPRGICRATFIDSAAESTELTAIKKHWPQAQLISDNSVAGNFAAQVFIKDTTGNTQINLHLAGTNFQIAVWRALLKIPPGSAVCYADLACSLGRPKASRAVGTAVGANPVAFLIPCHRVILQSGALGGYRWGLARKQAIQVWERI